jgi:hypothetical protein
MVGGPRFASDVQELLLLGFHYCLLEGSGRCLQACFFPSTKPDRITQGINQVLADSCRVNNFRRQVMQMALWAPVGTPACILTSVRQGLKTG